MSATVTTRRRAGDDQLVCVHCGDPLRPIGAAIVPGLNGLHLHRHGLWRCQSPDVPYGHMGHPAMPCPPGGINPCLGYHEAQAGDTCTHLAARDVVDDEGPF